MRYFAVVLSLAAFLPFLPTETFAGSTLQASRSIRAPVGFSSACARYAWLCQNKGGKPLNENEALSLLQSVNRQVNSSVTPAYDTATTGKAEYWSLPINNKGDCEDYALLKLKTLLNAGFPANRLAMSVVIDHGGNNHVVLIARLSSGDYVLDNLSRNIKQWGSTGYTFLATQNFNNKRAWQVTLAGPRARQFSGT
ncbi:transglutaminase-like cysteine peptidase [Rhizobium sp. S152]|uniref:transglutaminase-like cysteine peptidase n=1 Tax=Rhizobium sp. S152 TaxID=3055038 RepID=UPI0025A96A6C|nr:transglutaminase-like cysteine peptidase [Rhizobium sp. S152]MDM9626106.1 transglutaminase-like cysteine peptidase [Rhizobium sp. S152]